jgi:hypothetical protein
VSNRFATIPTVVLKGGHHDCSAAAPIGLPQESDMGKYLIGWLLGIPAIVLLLLWLFFR